MASNRITKLKPAPLAFPDGGGLKAMATNNNSLKQKEIAAAEAQHAVNLEKINQKYTKAAQAGKK